MDTSRFNPFSPTLSDLGKFTTLEDAEKDNLVQTTVVDEPVPFGYLFPEWQLMKEQMQQGDKLQYFHRENGDGLALIRGEELVNWIGGGIPKHKRD